LKKDVYLGWGAVKVQGSKSKGQSSRVKVQGMRKTFFRILAKLNKIFLPSLARLDMNKLSKTDKALIAYKYWVVMHILD
jgi:hypothetical protein